MRWKPGWRRVDARAYSCTRACSCARANACTRAALTSGHALAPGRALAPGPPLRLYPSSRPSRPELLYRGQIHADEQRNGRPQPQHAPSHGQPFDLVVGEVLISYPPRTRLCKRLPGPVNAGEPRRIPKRTFRRPKAEDRSRHFPLRPKTSGAVNAGEPRPLLTQTFRSAKREDRLRGGTGALRWEFTSGLSTCRRPERQPWQPQWHPQAGCSWARR